MKIKHLTPLLLSALMLSACDKMSESNCSSEAAHKLISQNLIEAVEKQTANEKYSNTGEFIFDKAKIRASLDQLQIMVENVITTEKDPNSTKKFCSAVLKVTVPTSMLADANQGRELNNKPNISQEARTLDIDDNLNVFTKKDFNFNVQPTDDGKQLYVESENTIWVKLLHDITSSALLKPILEVQKAEQAQRDAQVKQEQAKENEQEKQDVAQLKQEAEVSKLEAEKLEALQEKQDANRVKQELLEKQAAIMASEQAATRASTVTSAETQSPPVQSTSSARKFFKPSFDCAKASTDAELLICSSPDLAAADVELSQVYKRVFENTIDTKALKSEQNQWRKGYRDACADVVCMMNAYAVRIKQLSQR